MPFAEAKHPRDHGRFASAGAPHFSHVPLAAAVTPRRSLERSSSLWRSAAGIRAVPASATAEPPPKPDRPTMFHRSYKIAVPMGMQAFKHKQAFLAFARAHNRETGREPKRRPTAVAEPEHQVGTFTHHEFRMQALPGVSPEDHLAYVRKLGAHIKADRADTIDQAITKGVQVKSHKMNGPSHITWNVPEGTPRSSLNKAFNHASLLALHDMGVGHYKFAMDDHLKTEMTPLVPFIRHARRRQTNNLLAGFKGQREPYKQAFGKPFKDGRKDAAGNTRMRLKANDVLVKAHAMGAAWPGR